ncbi:MAG: class I SAM-dependent methyltransferase [Opitutales bacterium]
MVKLKSFQGIVANDLDTPLAAGAAQCRTRLVAFLDINMKTRESGMPEEATWKGFFKPEGVLALLGLNAGTKRVVDFGSGYGTFSLPAAERIEGEVIGLDIEPGLIECCQHKAQKAGLDNVRFLCRDFVAEGSGLEDRSADYVMLFNILHAEQPAILLNEARRILTGSTS